MKASVELARGLSGFVRVGPRHCSWENGDDYDFFVGFDAPSWPADDTAYIKGLVTDEGSPLKTDIELTRAHVRAATDALAAVGLRAHWERARHMAKKKIPHVNEAQSDEDHKAAIGVVAQQHAEGHIAFKDWAQEDLGNGEVRISVTRYETDPSVKAE